MNTFEQAGEALYLAHEGQQQIARALVAGVQAWLARWFPGLAKSVPGPVGGAELRLH